MTSTPAARAVIARRRAEQRDLVALASAAVEIAARTLDVRAAVVFGSVARGDFHTASDVDLLVVADRAPPRYRDRLEAFFDAPSRVEPVVWTAAEYQVRLAKRDPIAVEANAVGVWLRGDPGVVAACTSRLAAGDGAAPVA